jgi:oxygen-independent coproporphyrinogen-3 oxidase
MDLRYGLPNQTIDDVRRSARMAAALAPDRVAVFGYAHVPWFKSRQRLIDETALPGPQLRMQQQEAAHAEFVAQGYEAIGLDHYALPSDPLAIAARSGALRRNFHGYVHEERMALIGVGASAISTLPQGYAQNAPEIGAWRRAISTDQLATVRGRALTEDDRRRGGLIESLLCRFEADLSRFGGRGAYARELHALTPLIEDGLVCIEGERLIIPQDARPLARVVAEKFDAYRDLEGARHSSVI